MKSKCFEYYEENPDGFRCLVEDDSGKVCAGKIARKKSGGQTQNLKRHLVRAHPAEYRLVQEADTAAEADIVAPTPAKRRAITSVSGAAGPSSEASPSTSSESQSIKKYVEINRHFLCGNEKHAVIIFFTDRYFSSTKISVNITKTEFIRALVSMIVKDSLPFGFFSRSVGFKVNNSTKLIN